MGDAYFEITRGQGQPLRENNASIVCNELQPSVLEVALGELRREAVPALKKLSAGLETWTVLGTNLVAATERLDKLIVHLDNIAAGVEQGKGTAGRLLTDSTVADELEELLANANASMDELKLILGNVQQASTNFPAIAGSVNQSTQDMPALVVQTQKTMHEIERLVKGMQRSWLLRGAVRQADADASAAAATNRASRVKKP
jgi:phospholipid/cholesterol/gamma-HCH transport system substrate-binding protein